MGATAEKSREVRAKWSRHVAVHKESGLSASEYCRRKGLDAKYFSIWRGRLSKEAEKPARFIRIRPAEASESAKVLSIQTPGGYRLEVPEGTDGRYVQTILAALR